MNAEFAAIDAGLSAEEVEELDAWSLEETDYAELEDPRWVVSGQRDDR